MQPCVLAASIYFFVISAVAKCNESTRPMKIKDARKTLLGEMRATGTGFSAFLCVRCRSEYTMKHTPSRNFFSSVTVACIAWLIAYSTPPPSYVY